MHVIKTRKTVPRVQIPSTRMSFQPRRARWDAAPRRGNGGGTRRPLLEGGSAGKASATASVSTWADSAFRHGSGVGSGAAGGALATDAGALTTATLLLRGFLAGSGVIFGGALPGLAATGSGSRRKSARAAARSSIVAYRSPAR